MLRIPFYSIRGHRCAEACTKSVLELCLGRDFGFEEIKKILRRNSNKLVYPVQIANAFLNLGLNLEYYSKYDLKKFLNEGLEFEKSEFKRYFKQSAEKLIKHTDFSALEESIRNITSSNAYKKGSLDFEDIKNAFFKERIILCLLNFDIFVNRENKFNGHYIILTDITSDHISYNEVGPINPEPNKKMNRESFIKSWNQTCFLDEDTIFVKK